eukprot:gene6176-8506_t
MDAEQLKRVFEESQQQSPNGDQLQFSPEESERFKKAFDDPEFRKLFADYMDELQDPSNREETEAYISQLEGEQKVPVGKELIRPDPSFVAKTHKIVDDDKKSSSTKEKVFLNIVSSSKISEPTKSIQTEGVAWSLPYSLGPPHMERDKNGENAPSFDCCFHPQAIVLSQASKDFRNLLVQTAIEGVEEAYKRQNQSTKLSREFHVLKGITYKEGKIPAMMIDISSKKNWDKDKTNNNIDKQTNKLNDTKLNKKVETNNSKEIQTNETSQSVASSSSKQSSSEKRVSFASDEELQSAANEIKEKEIKTVSHKPSSELNTSSTPVIKKGFLNNAKSSIYDDKLTTIRKQPSTSSGKSDSILLPDHSSNSLNDKTNTIEKLNTSIDAKPANPLVRELLPSETKQNTSSSTGSAVDKVVQSKNKEDSNSLLKPVSSSKSKSTPTSDAPVGQVGLEGSTSTGKLVPQYSMKERGISGMGDFEGMRSKVAASNRPQELVYRIELPKVTKASQIVLDVSERKLVLSYLDIYELSLTLPYPVFDTKGSAKYDKPSKSLTVTIPVKPFTDALLTTENNANSSSVKGSDGLIKEVESDQINEDNNVNDIISNNDNQKAKNSLQSTAKVTHARWVSHTSSCENDGINLDNANYAEELNESELLKREIASKAQKALEEAKRLQVESKSNHHKITETVQSNNINDKINSDSKNQNQLEESVELLPFYASCKFTGAKKGYVFRQGSSGLGYYRDEYSNIKSISKERVEKTDQMEKASEDKPVESKFNANHRLELPEYELRQTKQAIAIILQVSHIAKESVRIKFQPYSADVSFQSFVDRNGGDINHNHSQSHNHDNRLNYGIGFDLHGLFRVVGGNAEMGGFDVSKCTYDVANQNMVIILMKKIEAYWDESKCSSFDSKQKSPILRIRIIEKMLDNIDNINNINDNNNNVDKINDPLDNNYHNEGKESSNDENSMKLKSSLPKKEPVEVDLKMKEMEDVLNKMRFSNGADSSLFELD